MCICVYMYICMYVSLQRSSLRARRHGLRARQKITEPTQTHFEQKRILEHLLANVVTQPCDRLNDLLSLCRRLNDLRARRLRKVIAQGDKKGATPQ